MKRRSFFKKLGIGVVSVPVIIKVIGEAKPEQRRSNKPFILSEGKCCLTTQKQLDNLKTRPYNKSAFIKAMTDEYEKNIIRFR